MNEQCPPVRADEGALPARTRRPGDIARPWLAHYPPGLSQGVTLDRWPTLLDMFEQSCTEFADRDALELMGRRRTFAQLGDDARAFAGWLQSVGAGSGTHVALMVPNLLSLPVALYGTLLASATVVNVNPLYTARELEHQLRDSGAEVIVIVENFCHVLQAVIANTPVRHVVVVRVADQLGALKGRIVDFVVRHVRKAVPAWQLPGALRFGPVLAAGRRHGYRRPDVQPQDLAFLQYTGGTTGVSKGAMLTHANVSANVQQSLLWVRSPVGPARDDGAEASPAWAGQGGAPDRATRDGAMPDAAAGDTATRGDFTRGDVILAALPLYHIFALTAAALYGQATGSLLVLIPNPRDLKAMLKAMKPHRFTAIPGVNTLYAALASSAEFARLDFSQLRMSIGGGAPVQPGTAKRWHEVTGCAIAEGYGLTEASPIVAANPIGLPAYTGSIGFPMPLTDVVLVDEAGHHLPPGATGELAVRGPQVMAGYWNQPDETAKVMTRDGFLRTGDIATMAANGELRIVDRRKDMILVSGFNVYPNEVEQVVSAHPGVLECAAVGMPDERSGEAVKLVVVRADPALTVEDLKAWCAKELVGYKRPKQVEFRDLLPKSNVGKVLRRELR